MKIKIFEPPLCCSTGVCGPEPDKALIEFQNTINMLSMNGHHVERYAINQQLIEFTKNESIRNIIKENGIKILPVTLIESEIFKTGSYPTQNDFIEIIRGLNLDVLDEIIIQ